MTPLIALLSLALMARLIRSYAGRAGQPPTGAFAPSLARFFLRLLGTYIVAGVGAGLSFGAFVAIAAQVSSSAPVGFLILAGVVAGSGSAAWVVTARIPLLVWRALGRSGSAAASRRLLRAGPPTYPLTLFALFVGIAAVALLAAPGLGYGLLAAGLDPTTGASTVTVEAEPAWPAGPVAALLIGLGYVVPAVHLVAAVSVAAFFVEVGTRLDALRGPPGQALGQAARGQPSARAQGRDGRAPPVPGDARAPAAT